MSDSSPSATTLSARIDCLEDTVHELQQIRRELKDLRAENAALRLQLSSPASGEGRSPATPTAHLTRRAMLAASGVAVGGLLLSQSSPAAAANGTALIIGGNNFATGTTILDSTTGNALQASTAGVVALHGTSSSTVGGAIYGYASSSTGSTYGVYGQTASSGGIGVRANSTATSGSTYGVYSSCASPSGNAVFASGPGTSGQSSGFAFYGQGRLKVTGRTYLGAPSSAPVDADLNAASISFYIDETANALKVRVKYSNGTSLRSATIPLA